MCLTGYADASQAPAPRGERLSDLRQEVRRPQSTQNSHLDSESEERIVN